jgi:hypothetical protein
MFTKAKLVGVCVLAIILVSVNVNAALVSQWNFDDGTAKDSIGGNNGTLMGNAAIVTDAQRGRVLSLDGNGDYVNLGNSASLKPSLPFTMMCWIKLSSLDVPKHIFTLDTQIPNYYGATINFESDRTIGICYMDGGYPGLGSRRSKGSGNTVLQANQWYHIAAVFQGPTNMQIYINAVDDGGHYEGYGDPIKYTTTGNSYIGCRSGVERFFNGFIDDVRIYNSALTQQEIAQIVPEPATLILLTTGLLAIRRNKK